MVNLWAGGDNSRDGVLSSNIQVSSSSYWEACPADEGRIQWQARDGIFTLFDVTELGSWSPRAHLELSFNWDSCSIPAPTLTCQYFPCQDIGLTHTQINVNSGEAVEYDIQGECWNY